MIFITKRSKFGCDSTISTNEFLLFCSFRLSRSNYCLRLILKDGLKGLDFERKAVTGRTKVVVVNATAHTV